MKHNKDYIGLVPYFFMEYAEREMLKVAKDDYKRFDDQIKGRDYSGAYNTFSSNPWILEEMKLREVLCYYVYIRAHVGNEESREFLGKAVDFLAHVNAVHKRIDEMGKAIEEAERDIGYSE